MNNVKVSGMKDSNCGTCAGFTLIEVIVVMAILGILAAIAIPQYRGYIERSRKSEAKTNLASLSVMIEEYNSLYGRYCPDCTDANAHTYNYKEDSSGAITTDTITNWLDFNPKKATDGAAVRFDYKIVATANSSYTVTATPVTSRGVVNETFTLADDGAKTKTDAGGTVTNGW